MFHKVRGYDIFIYFYSDNGAAKCVLSSLLQMQEIDHCLQVEIYIAGDELTKLPVCEISNWLHQNCESHRERLLRICLSESVNIVPLFTHLKAVHFDFLPQFLSNF